MRVTEDEYQHLKTVGQKETNKSAAAWVRRQIFFKPDYRSLRSLYVDMRRIRSELLALKRRSEDGGSSSELLELLQREDAVLESSLSILREWFSYYQTEETEDGDNEAGSSEGGNAGG